MVCAEEPVNATVPLLAVKLPPSLQFPLTLMVVFVPELNVPEVIVRSFAFMVAVLPPMLKVCAVFATVIALNVWVAAVPLIDCAAVILSKVIIPAVGANVAPLLVQSPETVCENVDGAKVVPEPKVTFPAKVKIFPAVADAVPLI